MAKEARTFSVTDPDSGMTFQIDLINFYHNFGCQIMATPVANYGKENQKNFPGSNANVQDSASLMLTTDEEFQAALKDAVFSALLPKIKEKINELYK